MTAWTREKRRFYAKVDKTEWCWLWVGAVSGSGYGHARYEGRVQSVHRIAWQIKYGPVPEGKMILHRCDVKLCVRPDHLWTGTQLENLTDMSEKRRGRRSKRWYAEHPDFTPAATHRPVSPKEVNDPS